MAAVEGHGQEVAVAVEAVTEHGAEASEGALATWRKITLHPAPPLAALRTFEVAARHLSFTKAAAELHVTQGAVSHQIRELESLLGMARAALSAAREAALTPYVVEWGGDRVSCIRRGFQTACAAAGLEAVTPVPVNPLPKFHE